MPYAFLQGGVPVEIHPGTPFCTSELVVSADDGEFYAPVAPAAAEGEEPTPVEPLAPGTVLQISTSHASNALELYGPADLARYRIQSLDEPTPPAGKVATSRTLTVDEHGVISLEVVFGDKVAPDQVSLLKLKVALLGAGKLAAVETAMAAVPETIRIYWQSASDVRQADPLAAAVASAADLTIEDLFKAADQAEA